MPENPHFESVPSWQAAAEKLNFKPLVPGKHFKHKLKSLRIFVRDHKMRQLPIGDRSLEAFFGSFMFSQTQRADADEARRQTVEVSYGQFGQEALIASHVGRGYELGPKPPAEDIDGRSPSVVVWHDGNMSYMLASSERPLIDLIKIAGSFYG